MTETPCQWRSPEEPPPVNEYGNSESVLVCVIGEWRKDAHTGKHVKYRGDILRMIGRYHKEAGWVLSRGLAGIPIIGGWMPLPEPCQQT